MLESWFPRNYKLNDQVILQKIEFSGNNWQIFTSENTRILVASDTIGDYWIKKGFIDSSVMRAFSFGKSQYFYLLSPENVMLVPVDFNNDFMSYENGISFATALSASRDIAPDVSFEGAVFVEHYSRILPDSEQSSDKSDDILLGKWLSRGMEISAGSTTRMLQLMPAVTKAGLDEILRVAKIKPEKKAQVEEKGDDDVDSMSEKKVKEPFSLPGRAELETFFKDHVIDIVENPEDYKTMGIDFPSAFILQGPPGCGKTYAVEKLTEYLDWPSFSIDSGSVGSPYIHETSKKVAAIFDEAMQQAPAVLVIDEMESYLGDRANATSGNGYHIEEVAEFLRKIPEATKNHVLVIAMTNMISAIDPAIRRKGRFDHIIEVGMPKAEEIVQVLKAGLAEIPHDPDIDFKEIGDILAGHPMSDVAFVMREAARITAKAHQKTISAASFVTVLAPFKKDTSQEQRHIGFDVPEDE